MLWKCGYNKYVYGFDITTFCIEDASIFLQPGISSSYAHKKDLQPVNREIILGSNFLAEPSIFIKICYCLKPVSKT